MRGTSVIMAADRVACFAHLNLPSLKTFCIFILPFCGYKSRKLREPHWVNLQNDKHHTFKRVDLLYRVTYNDNFNIFWELQIFKKYSISLHEFNILVRINNSGLDALRILQGAYRYPCRFKPELIKLPNSSSGYGWKIPENSIPIVPENIQTDFTDECL